MDDLERTLDTEKYILPLDSEQRKKVMGIFIDINADYRRFDGLNGIVYGISPKVYDYLLKEGVDFELIPLENIGLLIPDEEKKKNQPRSVKSRITDLLEKLGGLNPD